MSFVAYLLVRPNLAWNAVAETDCGRVVGVEQLEMAEEAAVDNRERGTEVRVVAEQEAGTLRLEDKDWEVEVMATVVGCGSVGCWVVSFNDLLRLGDVEDLEGGWSGPFSGVAVRDAVCRYTHGLSEVSNVGAGCCCGRQIVPFGTLHTWDGAGGVLDGLVVGAGVLGDWTAFVYRCAPREGRFTFLVAIYFFTIIWQQLSTHVIRRYLGDQKGHTYSLATLVCICGCVCKLAAFPCDLVSFNTEESNWTLQTLIHPYKPGETVHSAYWSAVSVAGVTDVNTGRCCCVPDYWRTWTVYIEITVSC